MKRTVPLLITAIVGFVLIASQFIPAFETWGEREAVWFDVLASIAFVLGGGSLLKLHLKRISDRKAGWAYSVITLAAFFITLAAGFFKIGSRPADEQEFYGKTFVPLAVTDLPESMTARITGEIPAAIGEEELPLSVARQLSQEQGQLVFRGWMTPRQKSELSDYKETLPWKCTVERLFDATQAKPPIKGRVDYLADHSALSLSGPMTPELKAALLKLHGNDHWRQAVDELNERSNLTWQVPVTSLPAGYEVPGSLKDVSYDASVRKLEVRGPMSTGTRDTLARANFPFVRPMSAAAQNKLRSDLESHGTRLNEQQAKAFDHVLQAAWTADQLQTLLNAAGKAVPPTPTACELEAARESAKPAPPKSVEADVVLNDRQKHILNEFAASETQSVSELAPRLKAAGPFNEPQQEALAAFFAKVPTVGEQRLTLTLELLRAGPLSREQRDFLLDEYRREARWRKEVGDLFAAAHVTKYPWSGQYNEPGSMFGWLYDFVFKPLTATMFALLAFYVASAAFRAFRAKNLEAILLLGTAFIILLGRTFAGYLLTSWLPDDPSKNALAWLRIENLTILLTRVFATAGTRAIMIGIALGLASTSLKILLGIDRSYLGTGEE